MRISKKGGGILKRRILAALVCCLFVLCCALPVYADNGASYVENITTVTSNGTAQVTLKVTIHLDTVVDSLTFPLPENAKDVKLNGSTARASKSGGALQVDISDIVGGYAGDFSLRFDYTVENVVTLVEDKLQLELPLLCGFAYPITAMDFAVTLPDNVETRPYFTGGYRQSTLESIMTTATQGTMISGSINTTLDDRETITMTMEVSEEMFPGVSTFQREGNPEIVPMLIVGAVALLYWLLFLRSFPLLRTRRATPPEGVSAGELGCRLTFAGADLTMMVFTWAQLGYILIHLDANGRVILHKRMEMGNERSLFEVKAFKALFGNRRMVDGTGSQYARLYMKLARQVPGERTMCSSASGNVKIFRLLNCAVLGIAGVCLAMNMTGLQVLQVLLAILLAIFGAVSAWFIQQGMYRLHLRDKRMLYVSLGLGAIWLLLSLLAGVFLIGLVTLLVQFLAGLAAAYGGRRSEMGRQNAVEIISYRSYLKKLPKEELQRLRKADPECFFNMMPYAMALDVDKAFTKHFEKRKLPPCPYLITNAHGRHSAAYWAKQLRRAADTLDQRHRAMETEKFAIIRIR